jgi:hypothetical protein
MVGPRRPGYRPAQTDSIVLEHDLVEVAPHPIFAWFDGTDDRMFDRVKMLGGMFVLGTVAATDMSARQTQPQMNPTVAHLQALFAALGLGFDGTNLIGMGTNFSHVASQALKARA